jgi:hypothetical protein
MKKIHLSLYVLLLVNVLCLPFGKVYASEVPGKKSDILEKIWEGANDPDIITKIQNDAKNMPNSLPTSIYTKLITSRGKPQSWYEQIVDMATIDTTNKDAMPHFFTHFDRNCFLFECKIARGIVYSVNKINATYSWIKGNPGKIIIFVVIATATGYVIYKLYKSSKEAANKNKETASKTDSIETEIVNLTTAS